MKRTLGMTVAAFVLTVSIHSPASAQTPQPAPPAAVVGPSVPSSSGRGAIVERVLVRVNGEIFTQSQLTSRQIEALQDLNRGSDKLEASLAEVTPSLLVTAVDELLLVQRGREMGVRFSDEQFKAAVENIKRDNKLDEAGLKAGLAQAGLTLESLRQRLERSYLVSAVQQREIGPTLSITVEEMRQYYEKSKARFMTPLTVTLRELMIAVPTRTVNGQDTFSAADDASAKARIDALRERAVAGTDFTTLVAEASDSTSKTNAGLVGPINAEDLNPALKDAIASLQPGGMTAVFRGPRGYQVFKLENRSVPQLKPFDTVRSEIEQALREERIEPETQKLLSRLRTEAVIEWKDEALRKLYEQELVESAAQ
jgi:peptidyl-prolyl cis-trans isomerase SurA